MLYKSLVLGILFGIGIFAAKSGVGLSYAVSRTRRLRAKAGILLSFALIYALVFLLAGLLLYRIDPVHHLVAIQTFLQSGMVVHVTLAGLMMAWGWLLLKQRPTSPAASRGWLMLVLPCPVCAAVIVFSAAFGVSLFPDHGLVIVSGLYLAFVLVSMLFMVLSHRFRRVSGQSHEAFLGGAMWLMATYFMLSVTIVPQFADLDKVYRLAAYHAGSSAADPVPMALLAVTTLAVFALGCGLTLRKIRRWT